MHNWPTKKLDELLIANDTGIWGESIHNDEKGILILRSTNFENDGLLNFSDIAKRKIPKDKIKNLQLQDGDILLEKSGGGPAQPVGRVAYFVAPDNQIYTFANFIQRLRPNQDVINSRFLFHCLFYLYKIGITLRLQSQTTGIRNLNLNLYLKTGIPIPLLHIQHQIVEQLDAIKKTQELNDKQIALAEELFQSLLKKELDLKGKNWELAKLEALITLSSGKFIPNKEREEDGAYPIYGGNGILGYTNKFLVDYSTIVIGRVGVYCGSIHFTPAKSWITDNAIYIKKLSEKLSVEFLYYILLKANLNRFANPSGQPKITQAPILKLKIPLPPLKTQRQIVAKLQAVQDYKKKLLEQKQKLQELFNSCLDRAMKGKLVR
jgi:type I restriction enzyme S subunit